MTITMYDIRTANEVNGFCFFSPDTMRYFKSRVPEQTPVVAEFDSNTYFFITSEQHRRFDGSLDRRYHHVRIFHRDSGDCSSGSGTDFPDLSSARKAVKAFAQGQFAHGYMEAAPARPFVTFRFLEDWNSTNQAYQAYQGSK